MSSVTSPNIGSWHLRQSGSLNLNSGTLSYQSGEIYLEHDIPWLRSQLTIGDASTDGAVTCSMGAGANTPVKVLVGADGTETIAPGQSAGNTAEGTFHLDQCVVSSDSGSGNSGNTGS